MATLAARAKRGAEARARMDAALAGVSARLGVPMAAAPARPQDSELLPILEIERFADFAEAVLAALPGDDTPTGTAIQGRGAADPAETAHELSKPPTIRRGGKSKP